MEPSTRPYRTPQWLANAGNDQWISGSSSQTRIEQPARLALLKALSRGAAKRKLREAGATDLLAKSRPMSRVVDQSSKLATSVMIDTGGQSPHSECGLGAAR
jgi:hypothetical protein